MSHKHRALVVIFIFAISTVLISACTQSLSNAPAATATANQPGLFVSPFPTGENPMAMIEEFAKQTAAAQTTVANGGTPVAPQAATTNVALTPQAGTTTVPATVAPSTPTNSIAATATTPVVATPSGPTATNIPVGAHPSEYILQKEEFPYCIARRFGVDPSKLIYNQSAVYYEGLKIQIPQSASAWPSSAGPIALRTHPDTYTVTGNADTTVYGVACKYGNVDPAAIVSANPGITLATKLTIGQKITINP
jgi:hypothetical protein